MTETWLKSDNETKKEIATISRVEKIGILTRNRNGRGGGVALAFDERKVSMAIERIKGNKYEVLCCSGNIIKGGRRIVVFVVYLPPKMTASNLSLFCDFLSDSIEHIKQKYEKPTIVITGDFNRKCIDQAIGDYDDIKLHPTAPTRGAVCLDLLFSNLGSAVNHINVIPPLESNDGTSASDHAVIHLTAKVGAAKPRRKVRIQFRPYTQRGEDLFGKLLAQTDWAFLSIAEDPAELLRERLDEYTEIAFPMKSSTIVESNPPWVTKQIRRLSRIKKRKYKRNRRSERWKALERRSERLIVEAKTSFFERIKLTVRDSSNAKEYFKAVKTLTQGDSSGEPQWNISEMFPGKDNHYIAEDVARFFNRISSEYTPLIEPPVNRDCSNICPELHEIAAKLKNCKKPKSQVPGDINPKLVAKFPDLLAIPLFHVFKKSFATSTWPKLWKSETVTVIPKCSRPKEMNHLRNLSCTPLFSKVMESFLLKELKSKISLNCSQFGGQKGISIDHFLIETWDRILRALEDGRAAATLASIDFEKAFNRVDHAECLNAARELGADDDTLGMIRAFLTGRTMSVRVNGVYSLPKMVNGGSPQGSILGNLLFCIIINRLNECTVRANSRPAHPDVTPNLSQNRDSSSEINSSAEMPGQVSPISQPEMSAISLGTESDEEEIRAGDFFFFKPRNRLYDTELSAIASQETINNVLGLPHGWSKQELEIKIYVDDLNSIEKVTQENAVSHITGRKRMLKVHAERTELLFEEIFHKAEEIKMKVNQQKTQLLCISAAIHDEVVSYIRPMVNGNQIESMSTDRLKIVGFNFSSSPDVSFHVAELCVKFKCKLWSLRELK